jgi:MerR family transcriptional regulator, heat shock protein HspR
MDWPDAHRGVFAISVAARLCGLHPQTLRIYEREGLVHPERSVGRTRLYSSRDVEKLQEIAALTHTGINIAGIKRVLELQAEIRRLQAQIERLNAKTKNSRPATS